MASLKIYSNDGQTLLCSKSLMSWGVDGFYFTKLDDNGYPVIGQGANESSVSSWSRMFSTDLKIDGYASSPNQTQTATSGSWGPLNYNTRTGAFELALLDPYGEATNDVIYYTVGEVMPVNYRPLSYTDAKIQVDSAIRDEDGVRIKTNYAKISALDTKADKPAVYERTTYSDTSTICTLIQFNASDYKANGYLAHFRFRVRSKLQDAYPSDNEFTINYSYRTATIVVQNSKSSTTYDIVQIIYAFYPSSNTYLDTGNYFIGFTTSRASTNFIIEMLEADVPYTIPATMSASTTTNTVAQSLLIGDYSSSYPLMWTGTAVGNIRGSASSATSSNYTRGTKQMYFRVGESDTNRLMAVDHTGVAYKINTSTKKFPLPISMYWGTGYGAGTTTAEGYTSTYDLYVSNLTSSSYNGFTMPTLTTSDGGKTLYVRGSLDADGYFVCDGNVTLSMEAGYTYIPFGTLDPYYSGSTAQVPTNFSFNAISAPAYTLDANGKLTHIDGKPVGGGSGYTALTDTSVSFVSNSDSYSSEYPYRATVTQPNVTASSYATAIYSGTQSSSGDYAPFCVTDAGKIYLYAKTNVGTQVIPTIIIGASYIDYTRQPVASEVTTRQLTLVSSTDTEISGYPYKYSFPCAGATVQSTADVTFGSADASSGLWSSICDTGADVIYIYARNSISPATCQAGFQLYYSDTLISLSTSENAGSDTKPIKIVNGQAVAVANDLVSTQGDQTIYGHKWFATLDGASVHLLDTRKTRGVVPSTETNTVLYFVDKDNIELGTVHHTLFTDGANRMSMKTVKDVNNWISLNVQISNDGSQVVSKDGAINGTYYWSELIDQNTIQGVEGIKYFGPYTMRVKNYDMDRRYRPSTYYSAGYSFCDKNNQTIGELRMTYDAQGSRRIEVNVLDANGGDHWVVLNNITV